MIDSKYNKKGDTVYKVEFDSLFEIVDYINSREINRRVFGHELASEKEDSSFSGTNSLEDALEKCLYGDIEQYDSFLSLKEKLDNCFPKTTNNRKAVESYYGYRPNVSKALTGNPKSMFKLEKKKETKFITMHYNVAVSWNHSRASIKHRGVITMSIIKFLESIGYRVNLNFYELSQEGDEIIYFVTTIKKHGQPLEPSICYFPMCHAAFLRRILFRVLETTEVHNSWRHGYGSPVDPGSTREILGLDREDLIVDQPSRMNVSGEDLTKDTLNYLKYMGLDRYLETNTSLEYDNSSDRFVYVKKRND